MKRKLFTMIVALMAVVGFQANAQAPCYYWIDADTTTNGASPVNPSPGSTQYFTNQDWTAPDAIAPQGDWYKNGWSQLSFDSNKFGIKGINESNTDNFSRILGYFPRYFNISFSAAGNKEFYISEKTNAAKLSLSTTNVGSTDKWNVVQFDLGGTELPYAQRLDATTGYQQVNAAGGPLVDGTATTAGQYVQGYLVYTSTGTEKATDDDFKMVFVNRKDGSIKLQTYKWWTTSTNKEGGAEVRNLYNPVWVRFVPITGRWATPQDFQEPYSYTKFKLPNGNNLTVNDGKNTSKSFDAFRVSFVGGLGAGSLVPGSSTTGMYTMGGSQVIPLFNLSSPKDTCKFVTVDTLAAKISSYSSNSGVFGGNLILQKQMTVVDYTTDHGTVGLADDFLEQGRQQFALWVDCEGNYTVYPSVGISFDYATGKYVKTITPSVGSTLANWTIDGLNTSVKNGVYDYGKYYVNAALANNTPTIPSTLQYSNYYFRIGGYANDEVVAPAFNNSVFASYTYTLDPASTSKLTQPQLGRYFYLEASMDTSKISVATAMDYNGASYTGWSSNGAKSDINKLNASNSYVLTVFPSQDATPDGMLAFLTPRERLYAKTLVDNKPNTPYTTSPFDSIVMASHWEIREIGTTGHYTLVNELGVVLTYNNGVYYVGENADPKLNNNWTVNVVEEGSSFVLRTNQGGVNKALGFRTGWWRQSIMRTLQTGSNTTAYWNAELQLVDLAGPCDQGGVVFTTIPEDAYWPDVDGDGNKDHHNEISEIPLDDSLCIYMYKNRTSCDIKEAFDNAQNYGMFNVDANNVVIMTPKDQMTNGLITIEPLKEPRSSANGYRSTDIMDENTIAANGGIYKWHYIKRDDKYMVYDTINVDASTGEAFYGFKFKVTDKRLATPIRFYQPLVGDKQYSNFIIEFIVPRYLYKVDPNNINKVLPYNTTYANSLMNWWVPNNTFAAGKTRYAKILSQTSILTTINSPKDATRFYIVGNEIVPDCESTFLTTDYLLQENLYLNDVTASRTIPKAPGFYFSTTDNEARNTSTASKLQFVLADTLFAETTSSANNGQIGKYSGVISRTNYSRYYPNHMNYTTDANVELYYVINSEGKYLTVTDTTDMAQTSGITNNDVSGAKLDFKDRYLYTPAQFIADSTAGKVGYSDRRALQMFAIYGCNKVKPANKVYDGNFIFLPAASYVMDYTTSKKVTGDWPANMYNNVNLGTVSDGKFIVTNSYRVGQYGDDNHLVVMPATGGTQTNITACEYSFTRPDRFTGPFCHHSFVQTQTSNKPGAYYTESGTGTTTCANLSKPEMHYLIDSVGTGTQFTEKFHFHVEYSRLATQKNLIGNYYVTEFDKAQRGFRLLITPQDQIAKGKLYIDYRGDNVYITGIDGCPNNDIFKDDAVGCTSNYRKLTLGDVNEFNWGLVEGGYEDRFVYTDTFNGRPSAKEVDAIEYQLASGAQVQYMRIDSSFTRQLAEHHFIPYYNIVRVSGNRSYYLTMRGDSAKFVYKTDAEIGALRLNPTKYPEVNFCFPYRVIPNKCQEFEKNKAGTDTLVFVQSLDTLPLAEDNYTATNAYLLKVSADSKHMAAQAINTANVQYDSKLGANGSGKGDSHGNVVNELDAAVFYLAGNPTVDYEWVELSGARGKNVGDATTNTVGWLTSIDRRVYVTASGKTPNYGITDVFNKTNSSKLTFEYIKKELIGRYVKKPIWYYYIINEKGQYLTNAQDSLAKYGLGSSWSWVDKPYAFFADKKYTSDPNYRQIFGLRYVPVTPTSTNKESDQYFWVVSGADYQKVTSEYFYMSENNGRLTFAFADLANTDKVLTEAMQFQFGKVADDGTYTGKDDINKAGVSIYGVDGAVKADNVSGVVAIYTIDGRLVKQVNVEGSQQISAPRGVVVVKYQGESYKVIVK